MSQEIKVWKQIAIGTGLSVDGLRQAMKDNGIRITEWANDILGKPTFSIATKKMNVDLVVVSLEELGYKDGASLKDIYAAAKKQGYELCPSEIGPQLRLQYPDQPNEEELFIGMEPISDSDGALSLFCVVRSILGLWLHAGYCNSWRGFRRFVFILPRK